MLVIGHSWSTGVYPTASIALSPFYNCRYVLLVTSAFPQVCIWLGMHLCPEGYRQGYGRIFSQGLAPYRSPQGGLLIYLGSSRLPGGEARTERRICHLCHLVIWTFTNEGFESELLAQLAWEPLLCNWRGATARLRSLLLSEPSGLSLTSCPRPRSPLGRRRKRRLDLFTRHWHTIVDHYCVQGDNSAMVF